MSDRASTCTYWRTEARHRTPEDEAWRRVLTFARGLPVPADGSAWAAILQADRLQDLPTGTLQDGLAWHTRTQAQAELFALRPLRRVVLDARRLSLAQAVVRELERRA